MIFSLRQKKSSTGFALAMVMIAIAIFSFLAAGLWIMMKVETVLAYKSDNEEQLLWLGRSGVEYARWILSQEASIAGAPYDSLNQIWAGGPGGLGETNTILAGVSLDNYPVGDGTVSLKIIDCERFANINTANDAELRQTLTLMGVDADSISVVADSILDWVQPGDNPRLAGAKNDYYQNLSPPYSCKEAPMDDLSELLLVKGVTPEMYYGPNSTNLFVPQRPHLPKLGFGNAPGEIPQYPFGFVDVFTTVSSGQININTAGTNVLQMIPGVDAQTAQTIIEQRAGPDGVDGTADDTPYRNVGDLARAGVSPAIVNGLGAYCTTRSSVFEVHVTAHIGMSQREFTALLWRHGASVDVLDFYWR